MNTKPVVVGFGEVLWDLLPDGKRIGGAPINLIYNTAKLGAKAYAISAVGDDELGVEILNILKRHSLKALIEKLPYPTGTVAVKLQNGTPSYEIVPHVAWDYIPLTPAQTKILKTADAFCFGTLACRNTVSKETLFALLHQLPSACVKFFDINLRFPFYSKALIRNLLDFADILKINDEELLVLRDLFGYQGSDEEMCHDLMHKYGLKYLILTAGAKFSAIYGEDEVSYLETPLVPVVDTIGAGDAFSGAFLYALLQGKSLVEAHHLAADRAALVCQISGAWLKK